MQILTDIRFLAVLVVLVLHVGSTMHAVLYKRDANSTIIWVTIIWMLPGVGWILYVVLGINRIQRKANRLLRKFGHGTAIRGQETQDSRDPCNLTELERWLPQVVGRVTDRPLVGGNEIHSLQNGEEAYPAMLKAIDEAKVSIGLVTYIFDNDDAGALFVAALKRAVDRGVKVRVLIDSVGARYSFPTIVRKLRRAEVTVQRFLPTWIPWRFPYANLRNHRKIMVVDGVLGFTGGMNIRGTLDGKDRSKSAMHDLHFSVAGPVVSQLQEVFAFDWEFSSGETLQGQDWFPALAARGSIRARAITSGPDDDFEKLRTIFLAAIGSARTSIELMTPYFLPDSAIIAALNIAALRGVCVRILLPKKNNLRLVQWACNSQIWQVLKYGCQIRYAPPPFDHSKLLVIDREWTLLGSANWDPRSLRLNFESNLECYCREFAARNSAIFAEKWNPAEPVTMEDLDKRPLAIRLRDGLARLFTPYL